MGQVVAGPRASAVSPRRTARRGPTLAERFRLAARRPTRGLATAPGREDGDGEGPEEDQPRGQEAQGRQEEALPTVRHRGERARQAEGGRWCARDGGWPAS